MSTDVAPRLPPLHLGTQQGQAQGSIEGDHSAGPSTARPSLSSPTNNRAHLADPPAVDVQVTYQPAHLRGQRLPWTPTTPPLVTPPHRAAPSGPSDQRVGPSHTEWDRRAPPPPVQTPVAPRLPPLSPDQPLMDSHAVPAPSPARRMSGMPLAAVVPPSRAGPMGQPPDKDGRAAEPESPALPKVVLHPPEEEENKPIKLHPPAPPPALRRPLLVHLPSSAGPGRPVSYQHPPAHPYTLPHAHPHARGPPSPTLPPPPPKARNMWGGMADQFGTPAPAFKRSSRYNMASGVVMPKTKEDMIRDRERRASMMYFEELRESLRQGEIVLPPRRTTSLALGGESASPVQPILSPPLGAFTTQRSQSAPSTPMTASFEHESPGVDDTTAEALQGVKRSESEPSELPFLSTVQEGGTDSDAASACIAGDDLVDSPVALTSPRLPEPRPAAQDPLDAAEGASSADPTPTGPPLDQAPALTPVVEESDETDLDQASNHPPSSPVDPSAAPHPTPATRKRRSMSLTSMPPAQIPQPAAPQETPSTTTAPKTTAVRKQKSLSRFFFSNSDLPHRDRDSPAAPMTAPPQPAKQSRAAGGSDATPSRKGLGGMLSRPKSSPALRTQARASGDATATAPRADNSAISSSSSSASFATVQTPGSTPGASRNGSIAEFRAAEQPVEQSASSSHGAATAKPMKKRFSLSNLSGAFKRSKKGPESSVPQVPSVPATYKERAADKASPREETFARAQGAMEAGVVVAETKRDRGAKDAEEAGQEDTTEMLISPASSPERTRPADRARSNTQSSSPAGAERGGAATSELERSSIVSDTSSGFELDAELSHARLMLVSPQTRRNPSKTFQDILNVAPVTRQSKVIRLDAHMARRSVEAIVLGPLLLAPGEMRAVTEELEERAVGCTDASEAAGSALLVSADGDDGDDDGRGLPRDTHPSERRGSDRSSTTAGTGGTGNDTSLTLDSEDSSDDSQTSLETMSQSSCASDREKSTPLTPSSPPLGPCAAPAGGPGGERVKAHDGEGDGEGEEGEVTGLAFPMPPTMLEVQ